MPRSFLVPLGARMPDSSVPPSEWTAPGTAQSRTGPRRATADRVDRADARRLAGQEDHRTGLFRHTGAGRAGLHLGTQPGQRMYCPYLKQFQIADFARLTLTRFVAVDAHRSPSSEHSGSGHLAVGRPSISVPRFRRGNSRDGLIRAEPRSRPAVMRTSGVPRCGWAPRQAMVGSVPHAASWAAVPRSGP